MEFNLGDCVCYLPYGFSRQYGIVVRFDPLKGYDNRQLFPIAIFDNGQTRFISSDFAIPVSLAEIPSESQLKLLPVLRDLASSQDKAILPYCLKRRKKPKKKRKTRKSHQNLNKVEIGELILKSIETTHRKAINSMRP